MKMIIRSIFFTVLTCICLVFSACGKIPNGGKDSVDNNQVETGATKDSGKDNHDTPSDDDPIHSDGRILIAYFSRADENYSVGYIEKGNTEIIAEIIAEEVGGELFHIERVTPYPAGYEECKTVATAEKSANARPALKEYKDVSDYDVIFIGFPIWWGDAPMPVYTFAENNEWEGKTVIPFSTHEGSGLGSGERTLISICTGAQFKTGLAIQGRVAQNSTASARKQVISWLDSLGF